MAENLNAEGRISIEVNAKELEHLIDILAGVERGANAAGDAITDSLEKRAVGAKVATEAKAASGSMNQLSTATRGAANSFDQLSSSSLPRARYALYDVAQTYGMVSAAALGAASAVGAVGVSFQSSYAQVQRTTGVVGEQIGQLRTDLEDLTTVIPESFGDISEIASLGGQLGIAADGIEDFTEVTAKLTATTDLSADAAGTALGRFQALLGVPSHEFENLASSILKVGVNSVATETQIVQIATQISSMGDFAGLTADQVVGLAGALASTGTQPELARGTVTRLFTLMSKAVGEAGDELHEFARVSGVSAADFQKAWGTSDFADVFQGFLRGLSVEGKAAIETLKSLPPGVIESAESFEDLNLQGNNVVETLNSLGITSVRDVPALLRLAGAGDVVANSFADAASGFADATELNEQYAIIAETVAAKLATLGNTIKAIMANIADSGTLSILGAVLSAVQKVAEVFLAISRNPVGKVILGVVTAFTLLVGVFTAVRSAQMLVMASMFAMITAQRELAATAGQANLSLKALGFQMLVTGRTTAQAATMTRGLTTALRAMQAATVIGAALTGLTMAIELLGNSSNRTQEKIDELFGSSSALADIVKQDTATFHETGEALYTWEVKAGDAADATETASQAARNAVGAQMGLKTSTEETTAAIEAQTFALGEQARQQLGQGLLDDEDFKKMWTEYGEVIESTGFKLDEWFDAAMTGSEGATAYMQQYLDKIREQRAEAEAAYNAEYERQSESAKFDKAKLDSYQAQMQATIPLENALISMFDATNILDGGVQKMLDSMDLSAALFGDVGEAAEDASDEVAGLTQEMIDDTNAIWGSIDATVALENSMYGLGASIAENGLDFSATSEAGRANLSSLGQVINAVMADAAANGTSAADAIAGLMEALSVMGVNVAQDLAFLGDMVAALGGTTGMAGVSTAALDAVRSIEQGFGSRAPAAMKRTRDAAKDVQKQLRTTADYASDLSSVFRDAFRFRFGRQNARDQTNQLWDDMKKKIQDAKNRAKELRLEIQAIRAAQATLQSRKAVLQYQLGVARDYGDTLREQQILAELGEIESDLADNKKDLKDTIKELKEAQEEAKASTEGNTDAARDQRQAIQDLLQSYADQIEEAARNGASQEELEELAKKLRKEFEKQAKQMGLSKDEIEKYGGAFDDMIDIIKEVPDDVDVKFKADASPAEKALANWKAKLDRNRGGKGISKPINTNLRTNMNDRDLKKMARAQELYARIVRLQSTLANTKLLDSGMISSLESQIRHLKNRLNSGNYATGGFTGRGGKYEAAGTVHRGEFVFPKSMVNQTTGLPYANVLGSMAHAMGAMQGGGSGDGIQLVELLPNQLRELARIVSTTITMDGSVIARATNGYNAGQYNRGAG